MARLKGRKERASVRNYCEYSSLNRRQHLTDCVSKTVDQNSYALLDMIKTVERDFIIYRDLKLLFVFQLITYMPNHMCNKKRYQVQRCLIVSSGIAWLEDSELTLKMARL